MVSQLEQLGAQLKWMDGSAMGGGIGGMFWRFLVAADPEVDRFIIRDSDCGLASVGCSLDDISSRVRATAVV